MATTRKKTSGFTGIVIHYDPDLPTVDAYYPSRSNEGYAQYIRAVEMLGNAGLVKPLKTLPMPEGVNTYAKLCREYKAAMLAAFAAKEKERKRAVRSMGRHNYEPPRRRADVASAELRQ